jgi:hypothetical protein
MDRHRRAHATRILRFSKPALQRIRSLLQVYCKSRPAEPVARKKYNSGTARLAR